MTQKNQRAAHRNHTTIITHPRYRELSLDSLLFITAQLDFGTSDTNEGYLSGACWNGL